MAEIVFHPSSRIPVEGRLVPKGEPIEEGDLYPAPDGRWKVTQAIGVFPTNGTIYARPIKKEPTRQSFD